MALSASLREIRRHMVRIVRSLVILQMAADARCARQVEVAVDMAVGTLPRWHGMSAGQRKSYRAVIEVSIEPSVHPVADGAIG